LFDPKELADLKKIGKDIEEKVAELNSKEFKEGVKVMQDLKKEQATHSEADANFGKPMENAATFKDVTATLVKRKAECSNLEETNKRSKQE